MNACELARSRVQAVNEGVQFLANLSSSECMDAQSYDDYSTPNRDQRLADAFSELPRYIRIVQHQAGVRSLPEFRIVEEMLNGGGTGGSCDVEIEPGRTLTLHEVYVRSNRSRLSADPHDGFEARWGEPSARRDPRVRRCANRYPH